MDKKYNFKNFEEKIYSFWEKEGYFNAQVSTSKDPFCIILPPPNANADLHLGHAMYTYEDVMIRYHKLLGYETLWLAGADHAGIETQFVYEKHLKKQGKSRFDFDRKTLFSNIWKFVMQNRDTMENQLRKLGFALDWSKKKFTMDEDIVSIVYGTFKHMFDDGLVYRANRLVNYCTSCGTSFSDLEVADKEFEGSLFYIKYPIKEGGSITIATTRPETYVGDVAVMVHPKDKRYSKLVGKTVILPLTNREIPIIVDEYVDPKFGTGAVKVTPNHDFNDFEIGKKYSLSHPPIIGFDGHMKDTGLEDIDGVYVVKARKLIVAKLEEQGFLEKITPHKMVLHTCYRCGTTLEPLPKEQWFIDVGPLKGKAIERVKNDEIQVHPKRFKKQLIQILENFIDWNVSRQIVWGIQIPAYKCVNNTSPLRRHVGDPLPEGGSSKGLPYEGSTLNRAEARYCPAPGEGSGLGGGMLGHNSSWFVSVEKPTKCQICGKCNFVQDEDTFDTWFSSAQWPFVTLEALGKDYEGYFYPTSVMETGYDILRAWVSRMIMVGYFETKDVPFQHIFLHGMVRDPKGQKMSKSKGNVINPLDMIEKYGADALRAALVFGTKEGGDVVLSEDKIIAMRNFCNKVWNIGRFIEMSQNTTSPTPSGHPLPEGGSSKGLPYEGSALSRAEARYCPAPGEGSGLGGGMLEKLTNEFKEVQKQYHIHFKKFEFAKAFDLMYEFIWHRFADYYIEQLKERMQNGNIDTSQRMMKVYCSCLQMLHPYTPFVTEVIWKSFHDEDSSIMDSRFDI